MYNKQQFHKFNCKKVLHKVKKQWVTISLALLIILDGGAVATHISANASQIHHTIKTSVTAQAGQLHQNLLRNQFNRHVITTSAKTNTSKNGNLDGVNYKINEYTDGHDITPSSIEFTNGNINNGNKESVMKALGKSVPGVGPSDYHLNFVKFDNDVNTSNASDLSNVLKIGDSNDENQVYFGKNFNTKKAYHSTHQVTSSDNPVIKYTRDGTYHMLQENSDSSDGIHGIYRVTITSPNTIFNSDAINGKNADHWKNVKTGKIVSLGDGQSHVGTWENLAQNTIFYQKTRNTGIFDGMNFKYIPRSKTLEFTKGEMRYGTFRYNGEPSNFLNDVPRRLAKAVHNIKFDNKVYFSKKVNSLNSLFPDDKYLHHIVLSNSCNPKNVIDMRDMFDSDRNLRSIKFPKDFNTHNVIDMSSMFASDNKLKSINLPKSFITNRVNKMSSMFEGDTSLHSLNLPIYFNTLRAMHTKNTIFHNGIGNMFANTPLTNLHLHSNKTRFNHYADLKRHWRKTNSRHRVNIMDGKAHVGNWITTSYRHKVHHHYSTHVYRYHKSHRYYHR